MLPTLDCKSNQTRINYFTNCIPERYTSTPIPTESIEDISCLTVQDSLRCRGEVELSFQLSCNKTELDNSIDCTFGRGEPITSTMLYPQRSTPVPRRRCNSYLNTSIVSDSDYFSSVTQSTASDALPDITLCNYNQSDDSNDGFSLASEDSQVLNSTYTVTKSTNCNKHNQDSDASTFMKKTINKHAITARKSVKQVIEKSRKKDILKKLKNFGKHFHSRKSNCSQLEVLAVL